MEQAPERFMQLGKSSMEAALSVANITLQSTERLIDLNLKTAKAALDESLRKAKALTEAKNVQDLVALQSSDAQPGIDKALAYSRSVYEVATQAQTELNKLVEARLTQVNEELIAALDKAAKAAPAGSEPAFAAFKSALVMANSAYDTFAKVARQATDAAVNNGSQVAAQVAKNARKKAH
ncbi:MAG: phasin family protein [Betaproteobacteria bacterium]|nr:phasin family protein [Betaproteobacteria bacterium]